MAILLHGDVFHRRGVCRIGGPFDPQCLASDLTPHQGMIYRRRVFERLGGFPGANRDLALAQDVVEARGVEKSPGPFV
jgi:hypothetical protein